MNSHAEAVPPPPKPLASWYAQGLSDGLGDRLLMFDNSAAPSLELLRFRPDLAQVPGFEAALRDQVRRLSPFLHPAFAKVRSVQRLEPDDDLALISNCTPGKRLSEVLHRAHGPAFAAALIRQLAPALTLFQQHGAGISHGVLNPDRIVVSPEGRLTIVEHVVGPAIDMLDLSPAQLASLGIALPPAADRADAHLNVAADWYQLGLVAVSVLIGRPVTAGDLPQLETLLDRLSDSAQPDSTPVSPFIRQWLSRALQISDAPIESAADARAAWEELVQKESPRDSRRIEPLRREQPAPASPSDGSQERVDLARDVDGGPSPRRDEGRDVTPESLAVDAFPSESPADSRCAPDPIPFTRVDPAPIRPGTSEPPILERPAPSDARPRPSPGRVSVDQTPAASIDQKTFAANTRLLDFQRAARHEPQAATHQRELQRAREALNRLQQGEQRGGSGATPRAWELRRFSTSVVAALALIAALEAGAIVWLARTLWLGPSPAIVVETAPSGENVLVSSRSTDPASLRLAVAPDLRWARVTSPSSDESVGAKGTDTGSGSIQISSPIALKVFAQSRLLGSVPGADLKVPAGRHDIELVNAALGYRLQQTLEVGAGQTVSVHIAPPQGWVTIDASPWAEVAIDGRAVGRTPLGPLALTLGEHQVTFRHPAGSSDRQRVTVKSEAVTRVTGMLRFRR